MDPSSGSATAIDRPIAVIQLGHWNVGHNYLEVPVADFYTHEMASK